MCKRERKYFYDQEILYPGWILSDFGEDRWDGIVNLSEFEINVDIRGFKFKLSPSSILTEQKIKNIKIKKPRWF